MDVNIRAQVRDYIGQRLQMKNDAGAFTDFDSLFMSGRLDSLDAMEVVTFLEDKYGIDFAKIEFDMTVLDSIDSIVKVIDNWMTRHPLAFVC
ncbi:MAG: acyl carrier protein [Xanthobacteraceae bacterium]